MITLTDTYQYRDGGIAKILFLNRPKDRSVISLTDEGATLFHYADGVQHRCKVSPTDLVKVPKWNYLNVDDQCLVRDTITEPYRYRYFAKLSTAGVPLFFAGGRTSWSASLNATRQTKVVLSLSRYLLMQVDGVDTLL